MILKTLNLNSNNLYNIADIKTKNIANIYIEELKDKGLLKNNSYFSILAKNIYSRTRVKNSEILELYIYGAYIEEQSKLDEYEKQIMYDDCNYYYQNGQKEVNNVLKKKKQISVLDMALFFYLLEQQNYSGFNFEQYIEIMIRNNVNQLYKQCLISIQQQRELEIENNEFQRILNQQNNQKLCINGDKISGFMDSQLIGMNNLAKVKGIEKLDNNAKVKFVAIEDNKTTLMCQSLDNQEFYINKENVFNRYYGETQKELRVERIRCKGLILGLNLPPITHHFHYCRSYIIYVKQNNEEFNEEFKIVRKVKNLINNLRWDIPDKNDIIEKAFKNEKIKSIALNDVVKDIKRYDRELSGHREGIIYLGNDWDNKSQKLKERTMRHEVGHALDYKNKNISCNGELIDALEKDKQNIFEHKNEILKMFENKRYKEYAELSDIFSGVTQNQIRGRFYHENEYWERENTLEKETFANLFAIAGENDIEYLQIVNKYLPNALKAFDGLIRRIE